MGEKGGGAGLSLMDCVGDCVWILRGGGDEDNDASEPKDKRAPLPTAMGEYGGGVGLSKRDCEGGRLGEATTTRSGLKGGLVSLARGSLRLTVSVKEERW